MLIVETDFVHRLKHIFAIVKSCHVIGSTWGFPLNVSTKHMKGNCTEQVIARRGINEISEIDYQQPHFLKRDLILMVAPIPCNYPPS
jgi:hypothetical protein